MKAFKTTNKKAISPVVAVLLLILVAVGAAVLIYLWLTGFAGKATQTPATLQTEFKIETASLYKDTTTGTVWADIYVRNTGRTSIDLSVAKEQNALAVYIYDSYTGDLVYSNTTLLSKTGVVKDGNDNGVWEPGELLHINFDTNVNTTILKCGHYYDIKVVLAGQEDTIPSVRVRC